MEYVISVFGGVRKTARALGYSSMSTVSKWQTYLPSKAQQRILTVAGERNLDITPTDVVIGREIPN